MFFPSEKMCRTDPVLSCESNIIIVFDKASKIKFSSVIQYPVFSQVQADFINGGVSP
ncbi:hypothetical protein DESC_940004 [Desulfosarcina cetonica]|nr:hypothetical protein DESC_940004 [Desulfosarcina cetonica]